MMMIHIKNSSTRPDCERDNVMVHCPNSSMLGFSTRKAKSGHWISYQNTDGHYFMGRVICRVTCDLQIWLEIATLAIDGTSVYLRWIDPDWVKECYEVPPQSVFQWITSDVWTPQNVHDQINYGVSHTGDQLRHRQSKYAPAKSTKAVP